MLVNKVNAEIICGLKKFISTGKFDDLVDVDYNESLKKVLLYPTNDFYLTDNQFDCIKSMVSKDESIYVMHMNWRCDDGFFDFNNEYYQLPSNCEYSRYKSLPLDTISIVFPSSFRWLVITDESYDGGMAFFIGEYASTQCFSNLYTTTQSDLAKFVEDALLAHKKRKAPLEYLHKFLQICNHEHSPQ